MNEPSALKDLPRLRQRVALYQGSISLAWITWAWWAGCRASGTLSDDAFITLRYASNLARGAGLVFNPGERAFGCTEPLLAVLLGSLHAASGLPLPGLATAVHAVALLATAALVIKGGLGRGRPVAAAVVGTLVLALPFSWMLQGFAWPCVAALLALAASEAARRPSLAGALSGLAVGFRPDALLGVAVLPVLAAAASEERKVGTAVRVIAGATLVVGLLILAAWLWFGQVLPGTLAAKQAFALGSQRAGTRSGFGFWPAAWPVFTRVFGRHLAPVAVLWGLCGMGRTLREGDPASRVLVALGGGLAVAYPLLGVSFWPWYVALPLVALLLGLAQLLLPFGTQRVALWRSLLVLPALLALLAAGYSARQWGQSEQPGPPRVAVYKAAAAWISASTPATARVAAVEVGTLAFYADRHVDDLLGLVSPQYIGAVAAGDRTGALRASNADIVVLTRRPSVDTGAAWFTARYQITTAIIVGNDIVDIYTKGQSSDD